MNFKKLQTGLVVLLLCTNAFSQNLNVTFRSQLTYPGKTCANICGYVDSVGNEYALVGVSSGMSIVNITDPSNPIQVKQIPNIISPENNFHEWKEIKVRGHYAYITTEGGGGLQIVNMRSLPDTTGIAYKSWTGDSIISGNLNSIHALHIDGHYLYLYGSNLDGVVAADIIDPWNPTYVGYYNNVSDSYVHDGYVRNDTLYAAHVYGGYFSVVDFRDKANPVELTIHNTPTRKTHNTWLSSNGKTLFTTDENTGSYVTAYNISNLSNITELDKIQSNPGSGDISHNTHVINVAGNDYLVTSCYKDGFTIVDAGRPNNLIQVGNYDTYPGSGTGYDGAWGVYPYLPSGTIVVSNIDEGLFVFTPNYVRACYLEGVVTDSVTGSPINTAKVEILTTSISDNSKLTGIYGTGVPSPGGVYDIRYTKTGYNTKVITGVNLQSGQVNNLNVALSPITFSVNELAISDVSMAVFPNPFTDQTTIEYDLKNKTATNASVVITDVTGREIDRIGITQLKGSVIVKSLTDAGIYFVKIINGDTMTEPLKVIKLK